MRFYFRHITIIISAFVAINCASKQDILVKKARKNANRSKKIVSTPKHSAIPGMVLKPAIS